VGKKLSQRRKGAKNGAKKTEVTPCHAAAIDRVGDESFTGIGSVVVGNRLARMERLK
jgi:hypothetical protein